MKITIVGGGNIGTQFAVHCAEKQHEVMVYTSKPSLFQKELSIVNQNGDIIHKGVIAGATDSEELAFSDADLIFVTVPAFCMKDTADKILKYANSGMKIGLIPGTGGGECAFAKCIEKGAVVFGMQRVPSVARLTEYGSRVCAAGYRKALHVAALPKAATGEIADIISHIFDMECAELPCYLNLTLTPSNPILHTTRLRTIFKDYGVSKSSYDKLPLFYEEWDDETSRLLFLCDSEVQRICAALTCHDLSEVRSLKAHYESETPEALTRKIRSIEGFKGLKTPSLQKEGRLIPDLNSRYFTADFSFGLSILVQIADIYCLDVPNIKATMGWYEKIKINREQFQFSDFGIYDKQSFETFYSK